MKLDTDKERAMSLNIENESREFEAWWESNGKFNSGPKKNCLNAWLAAKLAARSAVLSQEPVAYYRDYRHYLEWDCSAQEDNVGSMRREWRTSDINGVVRKPDGEGWIAVPSAPPAPVSAEIMDLLHHWCVLGVGMECNAPIPLNLVARTKAVLSSASLAPAAPLSDAKDAEFINEDDFSILFDFNEQAHDSEADGYTASKEEIKRLAELGVVQSLGFGRYSVTSFGSWLIEKRFEQDARLPLRTSAEHEKREHDAWQAYCDQMKAGDIAWINLPGDVQHQWRERAAIAAKEAM